MLIIDSFLPSNQSIAGLSVKFFQGAKMKGDLYFSAKERKMMEIEKVRHNTIWRIFEIKGEHFEGRRNEFNPWRKVLKFSKSGKSRYKCLGVSPSLLREKYSLI